MSSYVPSLQIDYIVAAAVGHSVFCTFDDDHPLFRHSGARKRKRRSVQEIFDCLGPAYFRRAYRMTYDSFWVLHGKIGDLIRKFAAQGVSGQMGKRTGLRVGAAGTPPPVPNGPISSSARLGIAIRYFAGGDPVDMMVNYGVGFKDVFVSVWSVVMAVNRCTEFYISYPQSRVEQMKIADDFRAVSSVGFNNCAGAIDGVLIWTQMPSEEDAGDKMGRKSFLCGRKGKFGLNMQAVSDVRGRILDISVKCGGASSDCLAFEASRLYCRLGRGLLASGLVLFGDNAYLNSAFMATPFPNCGSGPKDDYNFFHSQVSVNHIFVEEQFYA